MVNPGNLMKNFYTAFKKIKRKTVGIREFFYLSSPLEINCCERGNAFTVNRVAAGMF